MTDAVPSALGNSGIAPLLIDAMRCWRTARDRGDAVMPCLSRLLADRNCAILAPVLDSLLRFYENAIGRPLRIGQAGRIARDEDRLVGLVDGSLRRRACLTCPDGAARGFDCALCSARIMMALAVPDTRPRAWHSRA